ncbi:MAG: DnaD domain protein [Bacilli bacterium]
MQEIKNFLKSKNLVINSLVLKNINKLNISMNEFLLLIYFMNIKNCLDIESINDYTSLSAEEVLDAYNGLINKVLIETVVIKMGDKMDEEVSLEPFYNKITFNIEDAADDNEDIYEAFESEFGRTLSPIEFETINNWLNNKVSKETIKRALREAVLNGACSLRYIDKIIYEWNKKDIINTNNTEYKPLFEYDWLSNDNDK